ncbi:MAG: GNAT family N-acetyltransferase [Tissierellia bacterium]|nr:GNAT family N-acetyltransferase [Tissierellia bacterium]MDD4725490.1 GNAT family N-acetyltransferase [Tissierellia bacterium]
MKGIEIKAIIYGTSEYERSIDLRNEVFRKPWGLNIRDEDLTNDQYMEMFGAYKDDKIIATIFLTEDDKEHARIKSVAILDEYRGKGLGSYLMDYAENIAKDRGYKKVNLMGRVSAEVFYNKIGYKTLSQPYDYHTISHIDMEKEL